MKALRNILNKILNVLAGVSLLAMVALTCWQVFTRYILQNPSSWSEELVSYLFAWASLLGASLITGERGHMNIPVIVDRMSEKLQKFFGIVGELIAFAFSAIILVYGGMVMLCLVSFYFIFKPSKKQVQAEQQKVGFNAELPDPRGAGIEADKIAAYELEDMRVKQEQKMRTLEDFTAMTTDDEEEEVVEIPEEPRYTGGDGSSYRSGSRSNSFSTSTSAYNDINATLGSFYEQPREDPEKEALKRLKKRRRRDSGKAAKAP